MVSTNKFLSILWKIEDYILMTCLAIMAVVLFAQVVFRYAFGTPIIWSEELARYLHVWITFLGLGYGIRNKAHIEMRLVYQKMPPAIQKITSIVTDAFLIVCLCYYIPGAIRFLENQDLIVSAAMEIKMSIIYSVLLIGGAISLLHLIADVLIKLIALFSKERRYIAC